jgi:hypothetical protein
MIGLSVITNFPKQDILFPLREYFFKKKSDIDFDFIEYVLKKFKYSKLSVSGGTDPLFSLRDNSIKIEVLRKIAVDNKIRFFIYTASDLRDKIYYIKYLNPDKLVICNKKISNQNVDEVGALSEICPVRLYYEYSNQLPMVINIWHDTFSKFKNIEYSIREKKATLGVYRNKLHKDMYVIQPGDYNSYLMPNNRLYKSFDGSIQYITGYFQYVTLKCKENPSI